MLEQENTTFKNILATTKKQKTKHLDILNFWKNKQTKHF